MCWWFSLTAKLISMFLRYCWSFFTVFCWLKSLAHKKIEILCLLSVKDIYESPFVYVWTFRFHCLLILYLYDFPCFKYSLTWWWQMDTISLFGFDIAMFWAETEELCCYCCCWCYCKYQKMKCGLGYFCLSSRYKTLPCCYSEYYYYYILKMTV